MSNDYTQKQQEYIESVVGRAHMSAVRIIGELVRIIGELEAKIKELEEFSEAQKTPHNSDYAKCYNCGQEFEIEKGLCKECSDFGDGCGA